MHSSSSVVSQKKTSWFPVYVLFWEVSFSSNAPCAAHAATPAVFVLVNAKLFDVEYS